MREVAPLYGKSSESEKPILADELGKALKEGKKGILIRADQAVPYGAVIKVLDMTRKSGIQDVGLITELDDEARKR